MKKLKNYVNYGIVFMLYREERLFIRIEVFWWEIIGGLI